MNGKHVSSPSFIEVVATEGSIQNHEGILMNFIVGVIDQNGQIVIKAKPQILAHENEATQITVDENNGDEISLPVQVLSFNL